MTAPIAVQLYTVREALADNFDGVVSKIADMGYDGVETAGFPGTTPQAAAKLFDDLGLAVCSAHVPLPVGPDQAKALDLAEALGCRRIICAALGPERYDSLANIHRTCDLINEAAAAAAGRGLTFGIHNHWWEFEAVEGQIPFDIILARVDPAVIFEVDLYWAKVGGADPLDVLARVGTRAPLLHIKDGPANDPQANHVAVGSGAMDIPALVEAGAGTAEWLIVELDRCATDMLTAVAESYDYLAGL